MSNLFGPKPPDPAAALRAASDAMQAYAKALTSNPPVMGMTGDQKREAVAVTLEMLIADYRANGVFPTTQQP